MPGTWNLVSLRIHTLRIGVVVTSLELSTGGRGWFACHSGSAKETGTGANCSAGTSITRSGPDQPTDCCTHRGTKACSDGQVLIGGLGWRCSSDLLLSPLPASTIIGLKYLEWFSRARQNHHVGACRHGCASAEYHQGKT
jgi:hypothetical protein